LSPENTFGAHISGDAGDLGGECAELVDHGVDRLLQLENFALGRTFDLLGQIAMGDGSRYGGNLSHWEA
jgi:hypothetical protein